MDRSILPVVKYGFAVAILSIACNISRTAPTYSPTEGPGTALAPTHASQDTVAASTNTAEVAATPSPTPFPVQEWPLTIDEILAVCPTPQQIAEVDATIAFSFLDDPSAGRLVCTKANGSADLTRLQKNAYNAILAMKSLTFDEPLPWTDKPLFDWFTETIAAIEFRGDVKSHYCCGTPPTITMMSNLHILYSDRWTAVGGVMALFVHEARHTYKAHSCEYRDNTIAELGATGSEYTFRKWIAYHSDPDVLATIDNGVTDHYRQDSRWIAYTMNKSSFCQEPTPSAYPPALPESPMFETPFLTPRMANAAKSGVPIPVQLTPAKDEKTATKGIVFTWQPVEFPGGVTYNIEIDSLYGFAKDWQFWTALADDHLLAGTSFTLPLPMGYYDHRGRWRVWATSPAAGDGQKSEWRYFEF